MIKPNGSRFLYNAQGNLFRVGFSLGRAIPKRILYFAFEYVAGACYFFCLKEKQAVLSNLKVVLPTNKRRFLSKYARSVFRNFGKYLCDIFVLAGVGKDEFKSHVNYEGIEKFSDALSRGRGAIAATCHLGNWELCGLAVIAHGFKVTGVFLQYPNERVNELLSKIRKIRQMGEIFAGSQNLRKVIKVLKENEILGIPSDIDFTGATVRVKFFGLDIEVPKGPAAISIKTGAPVFAAVLVREKEDRFRFLLGEEIKFKPTGDNEEDLKDFTSKITKELGRYIASFPGEWIVFRKMW